MCNAVIHLKEAYMIDLKETCMIDLKETCIIHLKEAYTMLHTCSKPIRFAMLSRTDTLARAISNAGAVGA